MASEEEMLPDRTDAQELDAGLRRGHCQLVLVSLKGRDEAGYGRVKKMANFSYWNHLSLSGRGPVAMGMLTATQVCRKEYLSLFSPPASGQSALLAKPVREQLAKEASGPTTQSREQNGGLEAEKSH